MFERFLLLALESVLFVVSAGATIPDDHVPDDHINRVNIEVVAAKYCLFPNLYLFYCMALGVLISKSKFGNYLCFFAKMSNYQHMFIVA